jgi:uncharacterized RDD family membrane protein YckC
MLKVLESQSYYHKRFLARLHGGRCCAKGLSGMSEYWYMVNEQRRGPINFAQLKVLFSGKIINPKTSIWSLELKTWTPIERLAPLLKLLNPPRLSPLETSDEQVPSASEGRNGQSQIRSATKTQRSIDLSEYDNANRWRRLFARVIDIHLFSLPVLYLLFALLPVLTQNKPNLAGIGLTILLLKVPIAIALSLIVEALFYGLFLATPGKALLAIHVLNSDGYPLKGKPYAIRLAKLYVTGFAIGFLPLTILTFLYQSIRVHKGSHASYDADTTCVVVNKPTGWVRTFVAIVLIATGTVALTNLGTNLTAPSSTQSKSGKLVSDALAANFQPVKEWVNPSTGITFATPKNWFHQSRELNTSDRGDLFVYANDNAKGKNPKAAMITVSHTRIPKGKDMAMVVNQWKWNNREIIQIDSPETVIQVGNRAFAVYSGTMMKDRKYAMRTFVTDEPGWGWFITVLTEDKEHLDATDIKGLFTGVLKSISM